MVKGAFIMYTSTPIKDIRFWVQTVLPLVYDDSLSYYELLNKVVAKLNEVVDSQNNLNEYFGSNFESVVKDEISKLINDGTIVSKINSGIFVEDYGAIGDGVTDSTTAIQKCLAENPNSNIFFKGGTYLISKTIDTWGSLGGQSLNFGGATFKWVGGDSIGSAMFNFAQNYTHTPRNYTPTPSEPRLIGGNFDCNYLCGTAIIANAFHMDIGGCKIYNIRKCGIFVGDPAHEGTGSYALSLQANIHDILIFQRNNASISAPTKTGFWDSSADTYGLILQHLDSQYSNIVTNALGTAVKTYGGGNSFTNCHFTVSFYRYTSDGLQDYQFTTPSEYGGVHILLAPYTPGDNQINQFNNMYFNCGRYVVLNQKSGGSNLITSINDSHYTFYKTANVFPTEMGYGELCGGYPSRIMTDNFIVRTGANFILYDYYPITQVSRSTLPKINIANLNLRDDVPIINANNLTSTCSPIRNIQSVSSPATPESFYIVGAVVPMLGEISVTYSSPLTIEFATSSSYLSTNLAFTTSWVVTSHQGSSSTAFGHDFTLFIDNDPKPFIINNMFGTRTYYAYYVYLNSIIPTQRSYFKISSLNPLLKCYTIPNLSDTFKSSLPGNTLNITEIKGTGLGKAYFYSTGLNIGETTLSESQLKALKNLI